MNKTSSVGKDFTGMSSEQFRSWRKALGLKQKEAAERLGLKKRMIQYYEKGDRNGRPVEIPRAVRLACYALSIGISDFDGSTAIKLTRDNASLEETTGDE